MPISPPITVVLPAHNAEATIASAIASTLQQSYTDFELWVLENGSHDRTAAIARSFSDPRVRVFELGPVGVLGALQYAIENAPSEWLARLDADDLMFPKRLEVQMDFIKGQSRHRIRRHSLCHFNAIRSYIRTHIILKLTRSHE